MNILAFDTSFSTCSVGLSHHGQVTAIDRFAPMQQSKLILPLIAELLQKYALSADSLDAIAYGCGPGSFTGMRIAHSVAQGIGFAIDKPIIPISSMAILAQSAWLQHGWKSIMVCLDARMGQIHWAMYQLGDNNLVELQGEEQTCAIADVPKQEKLGWFGVGDGWKTYHLQMIDATKISAESVDAACEPCAKAIIALAKEKID